MVRAVERTVAIGSTAIQVFSDNPTAWRRRAAPPADLPAFRVALAEHDVAPLVIHGPYLLNLASPDDPLWERSIATLAGEMRTAATWGAAFVNVHMGSHRGSGAEPGVDRIGTAVARVLAEVPPEPGGPLLVLENSAGGGDGIGGTPEELLAVLQSSLARGADPARIAFCLDTAHAWGAGFDLSRPSVADGLLDRFDALLGPGRLVLVHLNDSRAALGSHADRHEHIGAGRIGGAGMGYILRHPRLRDVPFILETPGMDEGMDAVNMARVRALLAGEPLPPLEPLEPMEPLPPMHGGARPATRRSRGT
jgi:deoxyribonuclease-4